MRMLSRNQSLGLLVLTCTAILPSSIAHGQPIFERKASFEWLVADADAVVLATIGEVKQEKQGAYDVWYTVTLAVQETLKGKHEPTVTLAIKRWRSDEDLAKWKQQGREFLLFLAESGRHKELDARYTKFKWAPLWISYGVPAFVHFGEKGARNPLTLDLKVPTERKEILALARAAVAAQQQGKPAGKYVFRWHGGIVFWTFPVDARLEAAARRWIETPGKFAPPDAHVHGLLKAEAAAALRHFKSDENATLLKTLLGDPAVTHTTVEKKWEAAEFREFFVRQAAYETLQAWDVAVDRPVLREQKLRKVTAPDERAAITWIESIEGDVVYHDMSCPGGGTFRTVKLVNFASASLHGHKIDDLSLLTTLKNLENLTLTETAVRDLAPLTKLKHLRTLRLWRTPVTDLGPLAEVKSLSSLELGGPIRDITPLAGLTGLVGLDLGHTQVRDLTPLAKLDNLAFLDLSQTPVTDLTPLAGLRSLKDLNLYRTQITDLSPLSGLPNLTTLRLEQTPVSDLTPLAKLTPLESLNLGRTPVSDLAPLANLKHLKRLDLDGTRVDDVSPLKGLPRLDTVFLRNTRLSEEEIRRFRESLRD